MYIKVAENRLKIQEEKPGGRQPATPVKRSDVADTKKSDTNIIGYQLVGLGLIWIVENFK